MVISIIFRIFNDKEKKTPNMITLKSIIEEAKLKPTTPIKEVKETYFKSFTDAVNYARKDAEKRGYEINEDDWQTQIALGGKYSRSRPGIGKSHTFTVGLSKNGKPQRKGLQISVYGMESGNFELTHYIN